MTKMSHHLKMCVCDSGYLIVSCHAAGGEPIQTWTWVLVRGFGMEGYFRDPCCGAKIHGKMVSAT